VSLEPKVGMVICYDFLWKKEEKSGRTDGLKDRPCAIILASNTKNDSIREVVVCPITHSPPKNGETAVEIPYKVSQYLNLDNERMWIKTHEVNKFQWVDGLIPYGVTPTPRGDWQYGLMPYKLGKQVFEQVRDNSKNRSLSTMKRDKDAL